MTAAPTTPTTPTPQPNATQLAQLSHLQQPTTPTSLMNQHRLTPATTSAQLAAVAQQQLANQTALFQQSQQEGQASAVSTTAAPTPPTTLLGPTLQQPMVTQAQLVTSLAQPPALSSPAPSASGQQAVVSQAGHLPVSAVSQQQVSLASNSSQIARPPSLNGAVSGSEAGQPQTLPVNTTTCGFQQKKPKKIFLFLTPNF